eukprot:7202785-Pyramimonas_sp.AAC.1
MRLVVKRPAGTDVTKLKLHAPAQTVAAIRGHLETTMQHVNGEVTLDGRRALQGPLIHVRVPGAAETSMTLLARKTTTIIPITWDGTPVFNDQ